MEEGESEHRFLPHIFQWNMKKKICVPPVTFHPLIESFSLKYLTRADEGLYGRHALGTSGRGDIGGSRDE